MKLVLKYLGENGLLWEASGHGGDWEARGAVACMRRDGGRTQLPQLTLRELATLGSEKKQRKSNITCLSNNSY